MITDGAIAHECHPTGNGLHESGRSQQCSTPHWSRRQPARGCNEGFLILHQRAKHPRKAVLLSCQLSKSAASHVGGPCLPIKEEAYSVRSGICHCTTRSSLQTNPTTPFMAFMCSELFPKWSVWLAQWLAEVEQPQRRLTTSSQSAIVLQQTR